MSKLMRSSIAVLWVLVGVMSAGAVAEQAVTAADFNARGAEHYRAGDFEAAVDYFRQAYDVEPTHPTVRRNLCNASQALANELAKGGDFSGAAQLLEYAISVDPENPLPLIQLGSCYLRLGLVSDAIFRLEESLDLAPENLDAHELLGDAYYRDNDLLAALAQWEYVATVEPNRPGLREKMEKADREAAVERNYGRRQSRNFEVTYAPGTTGGDINRALTILEQAYREIGRQVGGIYPPGPIQVKAYTAEDFSEATLLGEHIGAVYDGTIRLPIIDQAGVVLNPAELRRRLYHEYVHVVLRHHIGDNVPWWLNEGLAETLSTELTGPDIAILETAFSEGAHFYISELSEHQLLQPEIAEDKDALRLAYLQAHAAVRYLWTRHGQRHVVRMLDLLAAGNDPESALYESFGLTYDHLDAGVYNFYSP